MSAPGPVGERPGNAELGIAAEDLGNRRDLLGFGAVGQLDPAQKEQSAHTVGPCLTVPCSFQDLNCNVNPGVRLTSHLLLRGCALKVRAPLLNPAVSPERNLI